MERNTQISHRFGRFVSLLSLLGLTACGGNGSGFSNQPVQVPTQAVDIDVPSAVVTPVYTLSSTTLPGGFPISEYNDGNFVLRSSSGQADTALLGSSHDASPAAVRVVQDSYDVLYRHEHGDEVPQNVATPVQTGVAINSDQAPFAVAMTVWTVTPTFTQNTLPFPTSEYDDGVFYLQPAVGGERIFLGNSHTATPDPVEVLAGSYDVIYTLETGGDQVPGNQQALVGTLDVSADISPVIDVSSVRFQFNATLDTAFFPASQYQYAEFFLRNTAGDRVALSPSYDLANGLPITQMVVEGTYDIVYQHVQGDQLPVNTDAVIAKGVVIGTSGVSSVSLDIQSVAITPAFTLDGVSFPSSEYNDANFYLRSVNNTNDVMFIGASEVMPAEVQVISSAMDTDISGAGVLFGNYDVLYRHENGEQVPQNTNAVIRSGVPIDTDVSPFEIAVSSLSVSGSFTLNGGSFPADASNSVQFFLRGDDPADVFPFGYSDISNEPVRVVSLPGVYEAYDVFMDHLAGDDVPQNTMHEMAFNKVLDTDGMSLTVDIPAVRVAPSFTLDNAAFPLSIYQSAAFYLRDLHGGDRVFLGYSYKENDPVMVIKEDHEVIYEHLNGGQVPQNTGSIIGILDL